MRLHRRTRARTTEPACRLCLGSGRTPYVDNHFALWMVPCEGCRPQPAATVRAAA